MKKLNDPFAPTPESFRLSMERTLNGLEEREMTKRKFSASLAVALALVMILAAAAVAGVTGGYVGWDGIFHTYEEDTGIEAPDISAYEAAKPYDDMLSNASHGERWIVTRDGEQLNGVLCGHRVSDEAEFLRMIENTGLPVPSLPAGYRFYAASMLTEAEETPYEETVLEDGAILSKYKLKEPVAGEVSEYSYHFAHTDGGNMHCITAQIVPAQDRLISDGPVAYLNGNEEVSAVEIEGFDYGICIRDGLNSNQLHLLQPMDDKMLIVDVMYFSDLPEEAALNLFNPKGSIDLSDYPAPASNDSGVDFSQMPVGEYWVAAWKPDEIICESRRNDAEIESFDEIARMTANKELPIPTVPDGWNVEFIFSMAPVEAEPFEEVDAKNDYILRKYRLKEFAEGDLEHYRFLLNTTDGSIVYGEVFPDSEMAFMEDWIYMPDFTAAESLSHPAFDRILTNPANHADDNTEYLFTTGSAHIYMHTSADVPAETVLTLFPAG